MATLLDRTSEALAKRLPEGAKAHASTIILATGAGVGFYTLRKLTRKIYRTNPFKFGNTGALAPDAIKDGISSYDAFFAQSKGKGIEDNQVAGKAKSNTPEFVDKFYRRAGAEAGGRAAAHGGSGPPVSPRPCYVAVGRRLGSHAVHGPPVRRWLPVAGRARGRGRCKSRSPSLPGPASGARPAAAPRLAAWPAWLLGPGGRAGSGGAGRRRRGCPGAPQGHFLPPPPPSGFCAAHLSVATCWSPARRCLEPP